MAVYNFLKTQNNFIPPAPQTGSKSSAPSDADQLQAKLEQIKESIDLVEADVSAVINEVSGAAGRVHSETGATMRALDAIRERSKALSVLAAAASQNARQLADATLEFSQSAGQIDAQVREATHVTDQAASAARRASQSVNALRESTAEIDAVVGLVGKIARQTNLLSLNATIEAARAGDMGAGFAIVANEVKVLSRETQKATEDISARVEQLRNDSQASIQAIGEITHAVDAIRPVFASVSTAVEAQVVTVEELSRAATQSNRFVDEVATGSNAIDQVAEEAFAASTAADQAGEQARMLTEKLRTRFVIFIRQSDMGDRRRLDRLPVDIQAHISTGNVDAKTVDLSEGGMLLSVPDAKAFQPGTHFDVDLRGIGKLRVRLVAVSHLGLHCQISELEADVKTALAKRLQALRDMDGERIAQAQSAAQRISQAMEAAINAKRMTQTHLFENVYEPITGSNPMQFTTRSLSVLKDILPAIQEPLMTSDSKLMFCAAVDRNAFLPVHNKVYSHPQRPNDPAWNVANSRHQRIFDDRAGLSAARNVRPFLIQSYARDMGNGSIVMMKEIDAPIRVFGKHWGGFRMAYKM